MHGVLMSVLQMEFLRPVTACILSERRAVRPFGILCGGSALAGLNLLLTSDGRTVNLGAKNSVQLSAGERLRILTPGTPSKAFHMTRAPCPCPGVHLVQSFGIVHDPPLWMSAENYEQQAPFDNVWEDECKGGPAYTVRCHDRVIVVKCRWRWVWAAW